MSRKDLRQTHPQEWAMANALRALAMDAVEAANSGHPGMPMGMADVATVLFKNHLNFDPTDPKWMNRDRFVLSAGHGSMLLYALLHLTGYEDMTLEQIKNFRQMGAITAGHPEYGHASGIETTTGPLGQGIATAVGMAIGEQIQADRIGKKLVDHFTYVIAGDGCLMEGISQEAISLAGHLELGKLIVLWDDNGISIDGKIELTDSTDQLKRFEASNWDVIAIDGHDYESIDAALTEARRGNRPTLIACKTVIGYGAPNKAGTSGVHGAPLGESEIEATRKALGWSEKPFNIPKAVRNDWLATAERGKAARLEWAAQYDKLSERKRKEVERSFDGELPPKLSATIKAFKKQISDEQPSLATRKASQMVLEQVNAVVPETIGGSADLTGSNNTKTGALQVISADDFSGRYLHYGIREHGMAAAMNGLALYGGLIPYGGTFLVFADYLRPALRLSALMKQRVIYVLTHDSIGLGEDGPTHQPVEHLASLRCMPNVQVFRPADAVETAESWEIALRSTDRPSVIALTRQNLPTLRTEHTTKNKSAQGAYVLEEAASSRKAILMASGSEVEIALAARKMLLSKGIGARVVSCPSLDVFAEQDPKYRARVLPRGPVRVAIEAGVQQSWDRWLTGEGGDSRKAGFVGMESFGASAPYKELYEHFGITAEAVCQQVYALLGLDNNGDRKK
ncbi:MAG: transketolase [Neomegalonema sp.]|nr:transketolase [Neomegalonema sp.]